MDKSTEGETAKAGGAIRILAVLLALLLTFATAIVVIVLVDVSGAKLCQDVIVGDCFDGTSSQQTAGLIIGWPGAALAGISTLFCVAFALTGRRGKRFLIFLAMAVLLLGASAIAVRI